MFFHLDINLNKMAHQWVSWVLLAAVLLHIGLHFHMFKKYFSLRNVKWMIGGFVCLLAMSFLIPKPPSEKPAYAASVQVLANSPLNLLALVGNISTDQLNQKLKAMGYSPNSDAKNLSDVVGNDLRMQTKVLSKIFAQ